MAKKAKTWVGRVETGMVDGKRNYQWVGRFATKRERDAAVAEASTKLKGRATERFTCEQWADRWLARYERDHKPSSAATAAMALRRFKQDFGSRKLESVTRVEAEDWADRVPAGVTAVVITCVNAAVDKDVLDRNPFRGLSKKGKGRSDTDPPTADEFDRLLHACDIFSDHIYAEHLRSLLTVAAYTGMRPGELFALEWGDVDLEAKRIHVQRRVYEGKLDVPKSGKPRMIALPPQARDALVRINLYQSENLVFQSVCGKRLSQATMSGYWGKIKARAGLDFDFYLATKHRAVHHLYVEQGLPAHVVAAQMGWSLKSTMAMLETYSHHSIGALDAIDAAFDRTVTPLRAVG